MALPKIDLPTFKIFVSSLNQEIVFRPFIVKEEKLLLIALESDDFDTILDAVKQVIQNCVQTDIDVNLLPLHEIEFLFLNLRARSMGEKINLTYICHNIVDEKKCKNEMEVEIDLLSAMLELKPQMSTLKITDKVGIKLKYPTIEASKTLNSDKGDIDQAVELIEKCTEYLFDDDQVYKPEDMENGEFKSFLDSLTQEQFTKIREFFDEIPKIKYDTQVTCDKCAKIHRIYLEGLLDFFA